MDAPRSQSEAGFGLIELVISMVILQVALLALISVFSSTSVALGRAGSWTTAAVLADSRMELYRTMPYDAIGLDTGTVSAPTSGMYVANTAVCPTGQTPVCANTPPRDNLTPITTSWSCTAAVDSSGVMSVSLHFTANGVNPCIAHRTVTGATSPDGKTYNVDTYVAWGVAPGAAHATERVTKQVAVIVRNSAGTSELAKVVSVFDCSTGQAATNTGSC
jgi:type II secretory pathway pseudopilin PulG